jgi:hypothetical protein
MASLNHCEDMTRLNHFEDMARLNHSDDMARLNHSEDMARLNHCEDMTRLNHYEDMARLNHCEDMARLNHCEDMARPHPDVQLHAPRDASHFIHTECVLRMAVTIKSDHFSIQHKPTGLYKLINTDFTVRREFNFRVQFRSLSVFKVGPVAQSV